MSNESPWFQRLQAAQQSGDPAALEALCRDWARQEPQQAQPWLTLGGLQLRRRRLPEARAALERAVELDSTLLPAWLQLAIVFRAERNDERELEALKSALVVDPYDLLALLAKGNCLERLGREHEALVVHRAACQVAEQADVEALGTELQQLLARAQAAVRRNQSQLADAVERLMAEEGAELQGAARDRFAHAMDIMLGRRQRFDPQPMGFFYPQLAPVEFFRRERFPWVAELEAQADAITTEFLQVLAQDSGFEPYLQYDLDQPLAQWRELNRNPSWSAFHLLKDGRPVAANAQRCPATMRALAPLPQPEQLARTPVAMFSCLKPRTHIPPHVGISNVRLVAHLPLIVPPDCAIRVGSSTHAWRRGEVCVFDDTIEHEAWNRSDELRVVLIFDVWHPDLSPAEQQMVSALACVQEGLKRAAAG